MTKRALIVEDMPYWQNIFQKSLEKEGFVCDVAANYEEAVKYMPANCYTAALLDIRLDELDDNNEDGLRILSQLAESDPETAVLIVTGHGTIKIAREAYKKFNAVDIYEKSEFEPKAFAEIATELVDVHARRKNEKSIDYIIPLKKAIFKDYQVEHDLLRILKPKGGVLRDLFNKFLMPFFPLLPHRTLQGLRESGDGFEGVFWSRALGAAIQVMLLAEKPGPELESDLSAYGAGVTVEQQLLSGSSTKVFGQVSRLAGLSFSDFTAS